MHARQSVSVLGVALAVASGVAVGAGQAPAPLPLEPPAERGLSVTAAYEGWYKNADGTFTMLVGYYNRNQKQTLEIPVGPNNRIDPGGPDQGQPTFFMPRRQWGVFTITVPKDFGSRKLTWTITANGQTTAVPISLNPPYEISPFRDQAMGNTPPTLRFQSGGPILTGPPRGIAVAYTAATTQPATIEFWAADKGDTQGAGADAASGRGRIRSPGVTISLSKFRGPGDVKFGKDRPEVSSDDGKVSTTAAFTVPGEYVIRVQANDVSGDGGGGFQCCWTNVHLKVTVK